MVGSLVPPVVSFDGHFDTREGTGLGRAWIGERRGTRVLYCKGQKPRIQDKRIGIPERPAACD